MTSRVYLVRHAKAGSRRDWPGDDRDRPLTSAGFEQARALAERLAPLVGAGELVSSPYLRCVQTLQPLAAALGRLEPDAVRPIAGLAEGSAFAAAIDLLASLPAGSVAASHGDLIPDVIAALDRREVEIVGEPRFEKASTWVIERNADSVPCRVWAWPAP